MNRVIRKQQAARKKKRNLLILMVAIGILFVVVGIEGAIGGKESMADPSLVEFNGHPNLKVDRELIDFGDVRLNTNLAFDIKLTNVGDKPLKFSRTPYIEVKEGC